MDVNLEEVNKLNGVILPIISRIISKWMAHSILWGDGGVINQVSDLEFQIIEHISDGTHKSNKSLCWLKEQNTDKYEIINDTPIDREIKNIHRIIFLDKSLAIEFKLMWM